MMLSVFLQGLALTVLLSVAFALGGYVSFRILASQRRKQDDLSLRDMFTNDQLRIKLAQNFVLLENAKNNSVKISGLCDEILTEILSEIAKNPDAESIVFIMLISQAIENYASKREKIL